MTAQLTFQNTTFHAIVQDDQIWITATELAKALRYERVDSVSRIYDRNQDEFTESMSQTVNLTVSGKINGLQHKTTRIFSLRGAHLVAMLAKTPVAKEFRKWVLDVLDRESQNPALMGKIQQAYALASTVAATASQTVFDAVMASDREWRTERWWFTLGHDRDNNPVPRAGVIPSGAHIATTDELAKRILAPDCIWSSEELANLASACNQRLLRKLSK